MSIKVRFATNPVAREYPYLGRGPDSGQIVLFTHPRSGTVVYTGTDNPNCLGAYMEDYFEEDVFTIVDHPVVLENDI